MGGLLLGTEQVVAYFGFGREPNLGAMTFAGALLMFQRVESRLRREEQHEEEGS